MTFLACFLLTMMYYSPFPYDYMKYHCSTSKLSKLISKTLKLQSLGTILWYIGQLPGFYGHSHKLQPRMPSYLLLLHALVADQQQERGTTGTWCAFAWTALLELAFGGSNDLVTVDRSFNQSPIIYIVAVCLPQCEANGGFDVNLK